ISMVSEKGEGLLGPFPSLGVRQVGPERSVAGQDFMGVPFSDQSPAEQLDVGILVQSHDKGFVFPVLAAVGVEAAVVNQRRQGMFTGHPPVFFRRVGPSFHPPSVPIHLFRGKNQQSDAQAPAFQGEAFEKARFEEGRGPANRADNDSEGPHIRFLPAAFRGCGNGPLACVNRVKYRVYSMRRITEGRVVKEGLMTVSSVLEGLEFISRSHIFPDLSTARSMPSSA